MKKLLTVLLTTTMVCSLSVGVFANTVGPWEEIKTQSELSNKSNLGDINNLLASSSYSQINFVTLFKILGLNYFYLQHGNYLPEVNKTEVNITEIYNTKENKLDIAGTESNKTETDKTEMPPIVDNGNATISEANFIDAVVVLVNKERKDAGLNLLTANEKIQAAANIRAKEQEISFSHTRPDGTMCFTALDENNVTYQEAGENIAAGQLSPEEVMDAWMNSQGHRENILSSKFTAIGVGCYKGADGTMYWAQLFTD